MKQHRKKSANELHTYLRMLKGRDQTTKKQDLKEFEKQKHRIGRLIRFEDAAHIPLPTTLPIHQPKKAANFNGYSPAYFPENGKTKAHKKNYCRRLIRNLERFEEDPQIWLPEYRKPDPPFLRLPNEIRQEILSLVLDDDAILYLHPRPNPRTTTLALVCKVVNEDMPYVRKKWTLRRAQVKEAHGVIEQQFLNELHEQLKAASNVQYKKLNPPASKCANKQREQVSIPLHIKDRLERDDPATAEAAAAAAAAKEAKEAKKAKEAKEAKERMKQEKKKQQKIKKAEQKRQNRAARRKGALKQVDDRNRKQYRDWARENVVAAGLAMEAHKLRKAYGMGTNAYCGYGEEN